MMLNRLKGRLEMKACPNEKRLVKEKNVKELEKKTKRENLKEDAKLDQRKRKK